MSFIFGGNTGYTAADAARLRARQEMLAKQRQQVVPRDLGSGLHHFGIALAQLVNRNRLRESTADASRQMEAALRARGIDPATIPQGQRAKLMQHLYDLKYGQGALLKMQLEAQAREGALNRANALKVAGMRGAGKKTTKAEEIASWVAGMRAQGINPTREQILAKFGGTGQGRNTLNPIQLRNAAIAWWRERGVQNPTEKQIAQVALTGKREGYKRPVQPFATPKQGYEYVRNPDGSVKVGPDGRPVQYKVEGGPAKDKAEKEAAAKAEEGKQSQQTYNTVVKAIDDFNDIYLDSKLPVTGTIGVLASNIPGTPQYEAGKALETLKSQIGLGRLAQMKKLSATGASGFGALSQKELDLLVNSIASIDQGLTYARLQKNLDYVRRIFSDRAKAASLAAIPNDPNAPLPTALPGGGSGQGSAPTGGMDADKAILGIE